MKYVIGVIKGESKFGREVFLMSEKFIRPIARYVVPYLSGSTIYVHLDDKVEFLFGEVEDNKFKSLSWKFLKRSGEMEIRTRQRYVLYLIDNKPLEVVCFESDDVFSPK